MPGIFGYVRKDGEPSYLSEMGSALVRPGQMYTGIDDTRHPLMEGALSVSRTAGLANGVVRSPLVSVWTEGDVYNLDACAKSLGVVSQDFASLLSIAYQRQQLPEFLRTVNGYYSAAIFDPAALTVSIISDRFGLRPVYLYFHNGRFAWSSEVKGLLALPFVEKIVDQNACQDFLHLGHMLQEETWFEHIQLIKPASIVTYSLKVQSIHQDYYWSWSSISASQDSFSQAVDRTAELLANAVSRRVVPGERLGISLSGGLDSRLILASCVQANPHLKGVLYTFGKKGCEDIRIAQQVARKCGWKHELLPLNSANWFEPRIPKVWDSDGMYSLSQMHGSEFSNHMSAHIDVNLNGFLGDAVLGASYSEKLGQPNQRITRAVAERIYGEGGKRLNVEDAFYDIAHAEPLLYMNRARRLIHNGVWICEDVLGQRLPFFDNDLIEYLFSLPDEYRFHHRLYKAVILKHYPDLFKTIPWQKTGVPVGAHPFRLRMGNLQRKVKRRLVRWGLLLDRRGYVDYPRWIREPAVASCLQGLLCRSSSTYRNYFQEDYEQSLLKPHLENSTVNHAEQILRVATMELYLRKACG